MAAKRRPKRKRPRANSAAVEQAMDRLRKFVKHPRTRTNIRHVALATPKLQRMFKHVFNSLRREGVSEADAVRIAAATVNQYRADHGMTIEERGRRGWWPGKRTRRRR